MSDPLRSGKELFLLDVPFYTNTSADGDRCYQVAMKSVLKYFLGKEFDLDELDRLTKRKPRKATATSQIVPVLHDLGLEVRYFSKTEIEPMLEGESYIRRLYGKDAEVILKWVDVEVMVESARVLLTYDLFEKKVLSVGEIEGYIRAGHVPLVLLDWNRLNNRDSYHGHFGVLTGFDTENFYFHQSGPSDPTPNLRIGKKAFLDAWNANGTDNDIVIVYGARKQKRGV